MKKTITGLFIFVILFSYTGIQSSCNKTGDTDTDSNSSPPSNFTWTYKGSTYKADLDTAFVNYPFVPYQIIAVIGTNFYITPTQKISFSLTSFNTGDFSIASGPGINILHYIDVLGYDHSGVSGTLSITSNANNLLSGNFSAIMAGPSGNEPISGSFTNVPVRP